MEKPVSVSRKTNLADKILLVDGVSGAGKIVLCNVLQGLKRVENIRAEFNLDYVACLNYLGHLKDEGADVLLNLITDVLVYNHSISRELNFRPTDETSVLLSHQRALYLDRLFLPDGKPALERIKHDKPILHLMMHHTFSMAEILFRTFSERLVYAEIVRHPLNVLRHGFGYVERYGTDVLDFTLWIDHKGATLPWFALGNEEHYLSANAMDKVIYSLKWMGEMKDRARNKLTSEERARYHVVPFEHFVVNPDPYIHKFCKALDTTPREEMPAILQQLNIPRKTSNALPEGYWSSKYSDQAQQVSAGERADLDANMAFAESHASREGIAVLQELSQNYELFLGSIKE